MVRKYGFRPLPPPPVGHPRDAHPRIKLPPGHEILSIITTRAPDSRGVGTFVPLSPPTLNGSVHIHTVLCCVHFCYYSTACILNVTHSPAILGFSAAHTVSAADEATIKRLGSAPPPASPSPTSVRHSPSSRARSQRVRHLNMGAHTARPFISRSAFPRLAPQY